MLFQVGGQGTRPTFFEMAAAQQLPTSLRAALSYSLGVLALRRPFLHKILDYDDEFFALLMMVLESHSLRANDASFSESLYGLRRRSIKLVPNRSDSNVESNDNHRSCLGRRQKVLSVVFLVYKEKKHVDRRESFVCGACGQVGHMRTNKNCPKYGEDTEPSEIESALGRSRVLDSVNRPQIKILHKKTMPTSSKEVAEGPSEYLEMQGKELEVKVPPLKFKYGSTEGPAEMSLPVHHSFDMEGSRSMNTESKQIGKNLIFPIKMKPENVYPDTPKPTVRILPPQGMDREPPKKIVIKQPKFITHTHIKDVDVARDHDSRKIKKIAELTSRKLESNLFNDEISINHVNEKRMKGEERSRNKQRIEEERTRRMIEEKNYEIVIRREELQHTKKKKLKNKCKKPYFTDDYLTDHRQYRTDRRFPERDCTAKRRNMVDTSLQEYAPSTKRRRGGEVVLSNILEGIVDQLRDSYEISYLFLKPVTKKEAPDYFNVIEKPMDLSTIREKVRNMEYRSREEFRHDVWQIASNAHRYNDRRNPGIPPLADQLLEICDYHLEQRDAILTEAEAGIDSTNI